LEGNYIYEQFHILNKAAKKEAARLKKQAAAEPTVPVFKAPPGVDFKTALVAFYTENQPDKVGNVDKLLGSFAGKEEELVTKMSGKYGLTAEQFYAKYA